ncbi:hypothetical protein AB2L27_10775 [Kineococcus sp. LSe6-4]|uniref:PAS domain-containing protein n=1 Tax=Kineococcus halophytocola TaxID=3234027 RepID=A0ABV4H0Z9_9ACTN
MADALSREHHLRRRAERVKEALEALWGDELPDAPDPVLTVLVDAVAVDDQQGVDERLVVQGDGLGYEALARVLADVRSSATLHLVPPALRARLAGVLPTAGRLVDLRISGPAALPSEATGAWEYDATADTLAWDARSGTLYGLGPQPGHAPLPQWLARTVHEEDRAPVSSALRSSASTGLPCEVRFRVLPPHHGVVVARGRVLTAPDGRARVLGFAAEDVVVH